MAQTTFEFNRHVMAIETLMGRMRSSLRSYRLVRSRDDIRVADLPIQQGSVGRSLLEQNHELRIGAGKFETAIVSDLQDNIEERVVTRRGVSQISEAFGEVKHRFTHIESMMAAVYRTKDEPPVQSVLLRQIRVELGELEEAIIETEAVIQKATL